MEPILDTVLKCWFDSKIESRHFRRNYEGKSGYSLKEKDLL